MSAPTKSDNPWDRKHSKTAIATGTSLSSDRFESAPRKKFKAAGSVDVVLLQKKINEVKQQQHRRDLIALEGKACVHLPLSHNSGASPRRGSNSKIGVFIGVPAVVVPLSNPRPTTAAADEFREIFSTKGFPNYDDAEEKLPIQTVVDVKKKIYVIFNPARVALADLDGILSAEEIIGLESIGVTTVGHLPKLTASELIKFCLTLEKLAKIQVAAAAMKKPHSTVTGVSKLTIDRTSFFLIISLHSRTSTIEICRSTPTTASRRSSGSAPTNGFV